MKERDQVFINLGRVLLRGNKIGDAEEHKMKSQDPQMLRGRNRIEPNSKKWIKEGIDAGIGLVQKKE